VLLPGGTRGKAENAEKARPADHQCFKYIFTTDRSSFALIITSPSFWLR
jgi:hypothetical protein